MALFSLLLKFSGFPFLGDGSVFNHYFFLVLNPSRTHRVVCDMIVRTVIASKRVPMKIYSTVFT